MRNDNDKKASLILALCGIVPVVWFALLTAPFVSGGLVEIVRNLPQAMNNPFSVTVCEGSLKTALIFLLAYGMGIGIYLSTRRNTALLNGATQVLSTRNTVIKTRRKISCLPRMSVSVWTEKSTAEI